MKTRLITMVLSLLTIQTFAQNPTREAFYASYSLEKSGNIAEAIAKIKSIYDLKSYECNLRLAYLQFLAKQYDESIATYKLAIDIRPFAVEPRLGFVMPASALNKWEDVINQYKTILGIDSKNAVVNYRLGYIYYNRKDYQDAYTHFERLVSLYPFDYDGLIMLAWTNYQLGKKEEARHLFDKALLYAPNDKSAKDGLGLIK